VAVKDGVGDADDIDAASQQELWAPRGREVNAWQHGSQRLEAAGTTDGTLEHLGRTDGMQDLPSEAG
jgi:hypothetical protein